MWPASRRSHRIPHREVQLVGSRISQFEEFLTNSKHIIQYSHVITAILHKPTKGSVISSRVLCSVQSGSEARPASYTMGTGESVPENEAVGA